MFRNSNNNYIPEQNNYIGNKEILNKALDYVEKLYFEEALPLSACIQLAKAYLDKLEEENKCK